MENTIPTAEIADSAQEPLPVLVVDDDDLFLKYCNRILDDRSFTVQTAVEAMKWGVADYIEKPFDQDRLLSHIDDALSKRKKRRMPIRASCPANP